MKKITRIIILILIGGCCNLPLIDCIKDYYYITKEGKCENSQSFCYTTKTINIRISPDFVDGRINNDGNGEFKVKLVLNIQNQKGSVIIINNKNLDIYCLVDNDTIMATLDKFEFNIDTSNKEEIILTSYFIVDKKYHLFLKKHQFCVNLRLLDNFEIKSIFEIKSKRMNYIPR